MKKLLAALAALALAPAALAAPKMMEEPELGASRSARNSLYVELGGNAGLYSVNYERYVADQATLRLGGGYISVSSSAGAAEASASLLLLPLTASWLGVSSGAHSLELGGGIVYAHVSAEADTEVDSSFAEASGVLGTAILGYRFAPQAGGFLFRAGFTPLFGEGGFLPWFGISAGVGF
jgi:hypothetical protein